MNNKKLKRNKTFSMKINLTMRSILKYSICSVFLLNFTHCTNVDEGNEPLTNITNHVFQRNSNGITLAWTSPTDTDFSKFLILKNTSPISDSPTTGHDYAGIDLIGSSQMMYNAAAPTFTDTDITAGITYFYKIFAYDVSFNYASGVQLKVDTLAPKVDTLAPSVTIPTSSLTIVEGGSAERYMISLATNALPPSGENVVINLSTNNALLTVNPSQLTLDSSSPLRIVTVTRVDNDIDESDRLMGMISHSLDPSTGASYNIDSVRDAVEHSNITVFMSDDDMAGFIFTPANREVMSVIEGGMMGVDYTVQLSSEPTGDVTLNVNPATGLSGSVASLTFTPFNWGTPQTVSITADDNNYVGGYTAQINHGVSSADSKYSSITPGQVSVNVIDDDGGTGNIIISTNTLAFNDIDGATGATYTLSLSHDPAPGKTVRVSLSENSADLEVSPMVVDFGEATGIGFKTIIVRRAGGASGMIMADISVAISHAIATGGDYDPNITTFKNSESTVDVTITVPRVDSDHDGLIEIKDETMFNNMRHDLAGASYKTSASQTTGDSSGCPPVVGDKGGCHGYELMVDIDLKSLLNTGSETAGVVNDMIDTTFVTVGGKRHEVIDITEDTSWVPINAFTGTFEGNNHTIANLWVNVSSSTSNVSAGLFGTTNKTAEIRNVGVISGSIHSSSPISVSGGLVGSPQTLSNSNPVSSLTIINSYFSSLFGGVSSSSSSSASYSGGLVGILSDGPSLTIINSYFRGSGGVSSATDLVSSYGNEGSSSGGLVGGNYAGILTITNSYFSGSGGVSSSSPPPSSSSDSYSYSGGLVGYCGYGAYITSTIVNSYFSGEGGVSSFSAAPPPPPSSAPPSSRPRSYSYSGGLVGGGGSGSTPSITNAYWNTDAPQNVAGVLQTAQRAQGNAAVNPSGATGLDLMELKAIPPTAAISYPSGLPHSATEAWNLGSVSQLPAIKLCVPTVDTSTTPHTTSWTTCASYGPLLAGQR